MITTPKQTLLLSLCLITIFGMTACPDGNGQTPTPDTTPDTDMPVEDMSDMSDMAGDMDIELTPETSGVVGTAVKGPFTKGAKVTVYRLDAKGKRTDRQIFGRTNDKGQFLVPKIGFNDWVEVEVNGKYFDEITGKVSESSRTLSMLGRVDDYVVVGNINAFTSFAMARVRALLDQGISSNIEEARERARAEFSRIFYVGNYPDRLSVLNVETKGLSRDNGILLWFSTSLIQSNVENPTYKVLVDDFADDGAINGEGVEIFNKIKDAATEQGYATARQNLMTSYGSAPPEILNIATGHYWLYNNCYVPKDTQHTKLCLGQNTEFEQDLQPGEWTKFSFLAPFTGTYTFGASFGVFNNFHRWTLADEEGNVLSSGDSRNNWTAVSRNLTGGKEYVFSAYNRLEELTKLNVDVQPASEGSISNPKPLMYNVAQEGWVGFHGERVDSSWNSYYSFFTDQTGDRQLTIQVNDFTDDMELFVYKGAEEDIPGEVFQDESKLMKTIKGKQSIKVDIEVESGAIFILVRNKGSRIDPTAQVPGRVPYSVKIY